MINYLEQEEKLNIFLEKDYCLMDFYADWCGPCKMLNPILEELKDIDILKINVDIFPDIAKEYGIMSIPTLCFFKKGELIEKTIGLKSLEEINDIIKKLHN